MWGCRSIHSQRRPRSTNHLRPVPLSQADPLLKMEMIHQTYRVAQGLGSSALVRVLTPERTLTCGRLLATCFHSRRGSIGSVTHELDSYRLAGPPFIFFFCLSLHMLDPNSQRDFHPQYRFFIPCSCAFYRLQTTLPPFIPRVVFFVQSMPSVFLYCWFHHLSLSSPLRPPLGRPVLF